MTDSDAMLSYEADVDTAVDLVEPDIFAATVTDRWNAVGDRPNGGYLLAICLRALHRALPAPDPLVVSAFYLRPGAAGTARVATELVRAGRRTATGEARLVQGGREVLRAVATFGDLAAATGPALRLGDPPALPPPADAVDPLATGRIPGLSLADRVEYRAAEVPGWLRGRPTGIPATELWMRFADGRPADPLTLPLLVDAAPPAVLEIGAVDSTTVELTAHVRARPAPGWLACRAATRFVAGGLHEEDVEIWDATGTLVAQSRQLALLTW